MYHETMRYCYTAFGGKLTRYITGSDVLQAEKLDEEGSELSHGKTGVGREYAEADGSRMQSYETRYRVTEAIRRGLTEKST